MKKEETYNVPGLEKGLRVIELLASERKGLTLQEIVGSEDITITTAYRIMSTLVRMEYVSYNEYGKTYMLTRKMLSLGYQRLGEHDLMEHLLPAIRSLRDEVKESVFFGVLSDDSVICIEQAQGLHPFKFALNIGTNVSIHASAPGKAMLAYLPEGIRETYLDKMSYEIYTDNTIKDRGAFVAELQKISNLGYAIDMQETLLGVVCIGAPIFDYDGMPVGAIWVSGPDSRITQKDKKHIIEKLLTTTEALSAKLGYITTK